MRVKEDSLGGEGDVSKYKPVMEVLGEDPVDSSLGQDYKSPIKPVKQYGRRCNESFLSRMKTRNSREHRTVVDASAVKKAAKLKASKKKQEQAASSVSVPDLIEDLECSQDMKKFIKDEFSRERALYHFLPDSQIASTIIHRFRTHIANMIPLEYTAKVVPKASLVMLLLMMTMVYMTITNLKLALIREWKLPKADLVRPPEARCLKITEKVSFKIASEASYVYI